MPTHYRAVRFLYELSACLSDVPIGTTDMRRCGSLPAATSGRGLAVVLPVLAYASLALYRKVFPRVDDETA